MKMNNKTYDILKYLHLVVLPALLSFYGVIGTTLNLPYTEVVMIIGTAGITCLGTCLGISTKKYNKEGE